MKKINLIVGLIAFVCCSSAYASLVNVSEGVGILPSPPASVQPGKLTSNSFLFIFLEKQNVTLTSPLTVDITAAGTYTTKTQITGGTIPAGTIVNSYYVHGNVASGKVVFTGEIVEFSSEETIIGLMVNTPTIQASDSLLGISTTLYDTTDKGIGLHFAPVSKDTMQLGPVSPGTNNTQVTFTETLTTRSITDFRIVTMVTPTGAHANTAVQIK